MDRARQGWACPRRRSSLAIAHFGNRHTDLAVLPVRRRIPNEKDVRLASDYIQADDYVPKRAGLFVVKPDDCILDDESLASRFAMSPYTSDEPSQQRSASHRTRNYHPWRHSFAAQKGS